MANPWAVRGVPEELIAELREHAKLQRITIGEAVSEALRTYFAAAGIRESVTINERVMALEEAVAKLKHRQRR